MGYENNGYRMRRGLPPALGLLLGVVLMLLIGVVVLMLARPVMGRVSDTHGRKPLITVGMMICMASFIFFPLHFFIV